MQNQYKKAKNSLRIFNSLIVGVVLLFVLIAIFLLISSFNGGEVSGADFDSTPMEVEALEETEDGGLATPTSEQFVAIEESTISESTATSTSLLAVPSAENGQMITQKVYPQELFDTYISNPGMGWVFKWGMNDTSEFDTTIAYSQRNEVSWRVLNPSEGVYDWARLDSQLNYVVKQGKQFSFRVYTMIGEGFGGHQVPTWVLDKGAVILPSGEPDYSNCVYQEEWAKFVEALIGHYDGNPDIAFIDISGYGNFNEWSWSDVQTEWDDNWQESYESGIIVPSTITTLDGQARRHLADMFIGGSNFAHQCQNADSTISTISYEYEGFQETQLVMPYAGIVQSTQYVYSQNPNVGFRHDCLGRPSSSDILDRLKDELDGVWRNAPIVFETCSPSDFQVGSAYYLLENTHASVLHNVNIDDIDSGDIQGLSDLLGYKYYLSDMEYSTQVRPGGQFYLRMVWQNVGQAPSYPKMGQNLQLVLNLVHKDSGATLEVDLIADISKWMPKDFGEELQPEYQIEEYLQLPDSIKSGKYIIKVAIIDLATGEPINLAITGQEENGFYFLSEFDVIK